jgi:hypothetical protein
MNPGKAVLLAGPGFYFYISTTKEADCRFWHQRRRWLRWRRQHNLASAA